MLFNLVLIRDFNITVGISVWTQLTWALDVIQCSNSKAFLVHSKIAFVFEGKIVWPPSSLVHGAWGELLEEKVRNILIRILI